MKFMLPTILFLVTGFAWGQGLNRPTVERLKKATVFVRVESEEYLGSTKFHSSGSGFFISSNGHVITNWHVVRPFGPGVLELPLPRRRRSIKVFANSGKLDEEVLTATILAVDKEHDLALLATEKRDSTALELGDADELFETSPLWVAGFPLGDKFAIIERGPEVTIGRGTVTSLRHDDMGKLRIIQTDAQFDSGNSGGPLIDKSGKLIGVAQSIVINNRSLNFAVPVSYVHDLMQKIPLTEPWQSRGKVSFTSTQPKGTVYVDGDSVGALDEGRLEAELRLGRRQVAVVHPDHPVRSRNILLQAGATIALDPAPLANVRIDIPPSGTGPTVKDDNRHPAQRVKTGEKLFEESFQSREILKGMEQSTGGISVRTWYIRNGQLHQHESSSALHAIYFGDRQWRDYRFTADVTIKNERNDSRAGLIFRETDDGFYLFRIHRETNQAQLAYHCKRPFGWFVLGEKKLTSEISGAGNRLAVEAVGGNIACRLNGKLIFVAHDPLSDHGRVGFYSVESRAAFDNALVLQASGDAEYKTGPGHYPMFWYTDTFSTESTWWRLQRTDGRPVRPWIFTDAGAAAVYKDDLERVALMDKYVLTNFVADLALRFQSAKAAEDARFGFVFAHRKTGDQVRDYRLILSEQDQTCRLFRLNGGDTTLVHESSFAVETSDSPNHLLFGAPLSRLILRVDGGTIELYSLRKKIFSHKLPAEAVSEGTFGFISQGTDLILHQLTVGSPQPVQPLLTPLESTE